MRRDCRFLWFAVCRSDSSVPSRMLVPIQAPSFGQDFIKHHAKLCAHGVSSMEGTVHCRSELLGRVKHGRFCTKVQETYMAKAGELSLISNLS